MDFIAKLPGTVNNGTVELNWIIEFDVNNKDTNYAHEIKEHGYTFIDYVFVIKYNDETVSSKPLIIMSWIKQLLVEKRTRTPIRNHQFIIVLGKEEVIEGTTTEEGYIQLYRLRKIGHYKFAGLR